MSSFEYRAKQPDGRDVSGHIDADNFEEASQRLASDGLIDVHLEIVAESSPQGRPLSATEAAQFAGHVAQFGATGLPLEAGLRAAAAEVDNRRIEEALNHLANQLAEGASLQTAIADPGCQLPTHVSGLIAAAASTGRLATALAELLDHQYEARSLRRDALQGFTYPLFVLSIACGVVFIIMFGISGLFQQMFIEFDLELPAVTRLLFWWRDTGFWILLTCGACLVVAVMILRQALGRVRWLQLISTMPVFGRMSFWSGLAEWTSLMSVLLEQDVPLPAALKMSSGGVRNAYVGKIVESLTVATQQGKTFSQALSNDRHIPASLVPVIRWGERTGSLPESLATVRELLARRVRVRTLLLRSILPPMLFILIVSQVGGMVMALFLPLISLIQGLS